MAIQTPRISRRVAMAVQTALAAGSSLKRHEMRHDSQSEERCRQCRLASREENSGKQPQCRRAALR